VLFVRLSEGRLGDAGDFEATERAVESTVAGRSWLRRLPEVLRDLSSRWSLSLAAPFNGEDTSSAWVAPVRRADGSEAVLKVAFPHFEANTRSTDYASGRESDGSAARCGRDLGAVLLERCVPGATLRTVPVAAQDVVISGLLRRTLAGSTTRIPSAAFDHAGILDT
jgi:streptomycin 6-kinase